MKLNIIIIISCVIAIIVVVAAVFMFYGNGTSDNPVPNKTIESVADKKVIHESQNLAQLENNKQSPSSDLAGPIHNQYGIRDDILKYIETTIPHWNKAAWKAATTIAAEEQFLNYKAKTDQEASSASNRIVLAVKCLAMAMEYPAHTNQEYLIFKKIEKLMANTRERQLHIWEVNDKHFAGKHYNRIKISNEQLKQKCETGDY